MAKKLAHTKKKPDYSYRAKKEKERDGRRGRDEA